MKLQKNWQKFTALNFALALGLFASLFMIPANTSIWILLVVFLAIVATMNFLLLARLRKIAAGEPVKAPRLSTAIIFVGFLIFLIDLALRLAQHSR